MLLYYSLAFALPLLPLSTAQGDEFYNFARQAEQLPSSQKWPQELVGTWSTKSLSTLTGPAFYDPINDALIEPTHTGISYSFTSTGHYEESFYRAIASPVNPACPQGILQWQHGQYIVNATGAIFTLPIKSDGRQLLSSPCQGDNGLYMRYNQSELFEKFEVTMDPYHNVKRLDLFQWDGTPVNPMYLVYQPPQMLPTGTLNPVSSATGEAKVKRGVDAVWRRQGEVVSKIDADRLWWIGLGLTAVGGLLYLGPRKMGLVS